MLRVSECVPQVDMDAMWKERLAQHESERHVLETTAAVRKDAVASRRAAQEAEEVSASPPCLLVCGCSAACLIGSHLGRPKAHCAVSIGEGEGGGPAAPDSAAAGAHQDQDGAGQVCPARGGAGTLCQDQEGEQDPYLLQQALPLPQEYRSGNRQG